MSDFEDGYRIVVELVDGTVYRVKHMEGNTVAVLVHGVQRKSGSVWFDWFEGEQVSFPNHRVAMIRQRKEDV